MKALWELLQPVNGDFFTKQFEIRVADDEFGFLLFREFGGGESLAGFPDAQGFSPTTLPSRQR